MDWLLPVWVKELEAAEARLSDALMTTPDLMTASL
jgi:hypothetical protein